MNMIFDLSVTESAQIDVDYTTETLKISNYPLSAALTCAKITSGVEEAWGVI